MGHSRRVVITGMGVVSSLGESLHTFWEALCAGRSGVGPLTLFDTTEFKVHFGGQIRDWDPVARFGVKEARHLDRFAQFALAAAEAAVQDAGIDFSKLPADQCGVFIGSGIGGLNEFEAQHSTMIHKGASRISPFTIPKLMVNAGSGQVSIRWGLQGPCSAVATACASASNVMGEGAGILILEAEETARARGARIYAEVLGYGMSADGWHITAPDDQGRGAARAMKRCLADASLSPNVVDYINAHGTSTPLGDLAETIAMKCVFDGHAPRLQISSTKSQLGHLLGASGGVELIISALAIQTGVLPPTINLEEPGAGCDLDYIPNVAREARVNYVMSNR